MSGAKLLTLDALRAGSKCSPWDEDELYELDLIDLTRMGTRAKVAVGFPKGSSSLVSCSTAARCQQLVSISLFSRA